MRPIVDTSKMLESKRSIIQIRNQDELCCARAIVTAIASVEKQQQWESIRHGRYAQDKMTKDLHKKA